MTFRPGVHPLTILHAPCHGPSLTPHHIRHMLTLGACSVGLSEAYRRIDFLQERPSWRVTVGRPLNPSWDELRGAHDAPILTRRHHDRVEAFHVRACDASTPIKLAPPRWVQSEAFEHQLGDVEHITCHPNAGIVGNSRDLDRVVKYRETLDVLEDRMRHALAHKRHVVVTGDLNYPRSGPLVSYAPLVMFRRLGFRAWAVGVDYMAHSPSLKPYKRETITDNGQDHPWMLRRFVRED